MADERTAGSYYESGGRGKESIMEERHDTTRKKKGLREKEERDARTNEERKGKSAKKDNAPVAGLVFPTRGKTST
jgi:hypothetical protein